MSVHLDEIIERIRAERQRQFELPGSEWDALNSPGEWSSLVSHYVNREVRRNGEAPLSEDFEDVLIKAAAVIVAALENIDNMRGRQQLL